MKTTAAVLAVLALVPLVAPGCGPGPAPAPAPPPAVPPGGMPPAAQAGGIGAERFKAPEGWESQPPTSGMRLLQYRLPRAGGDARDGEVAVFSNIMGSTKANIDRWRGQFTEVEYGKDALEEVTAGMKGKATILDISGKYASPMAPMAGHGAAAAAAPEATRMIGAVVESPDGVYFVKALGPPATMEKWAKAVRAFILDSAAK